MARVMTALCIARSKLLNTHIPWVFIRARGPASKSRDTMDPNLPVVSAASTCNGRVVGAWGRGKGVLSPLSLHWYACAARIAPFLDSTLERMCGPNSSLFSTRKVYEWAYFFRVCYINSLIFHGWSTQLRVKPPPRTQSLRYRPTTDRIEFQRKHDRIKRAQTPGHRKSLLKQCTLIYMLQVDRVAR